MAEVSTNLCSGRWAALRTGYFKLVTVSVDGYLHALELRDAVGVRWPSLCDFEREVIKLPGIVEVTDKSYAPVDIPYTFVLDGDLMIDQICKDWWFVGRRPSRSCARISKAPITPLGLGPRRRLGL